MSTDTAVPSTNGHKPEPTEAEVKRWEDEQLAKAEKILGRHLGSPRTFSESFDADTTAPAKTKIKTPSGHKFTLIGDVATNDPADLVELAAKQTSKTVKTTVSSEYRDTTKKTRQKDFSPAVLAEYLADHFESVM